MKKHDKNLYACSFGPAEQLYLVFQNWFTLTKVFKLRSEVKKSAAQSVQLQTTAITSQALNVPY